jgi:hypothetical protein
MPFELKDTIRFEPIKEDRGPYFVEYCVPNEGVWFATVCLVFPQAVPLQEVATSIELELERWLRRYSVPVMVTAFSDTEEVIELEPHRPDNHAMGWLDDRGQVVAHWKAETPAAAPTMKFTKELLLETYPDVPHKVSTAEDKRKGVEQTIRQGRAIRNIVIIWFVGIPMAIALITQFVTWAGWTAFGVSILSGLWKLAGVMGWRKKSKRQQEKEAEELRMKHHHYYCERDPEGFNRLKVEMLNREVRERTLKEAEELKRKKN